MTRHQEVTSGHGTAAAQRTAEVTRCQEESVDQVDIPQSLSEIFVGTQNGRKNGFSSKE